MKLKAALALGITLLSGVAAHATAVPNGIHRYPPPIVNVDSTVAPQRILPPLVTVAYNIDPNLYRCCNLSSSLMAHRSAHQA